MTGEGFDGKDAEHAQTSVPDQDTFVVRVWMTELAGVVHGHVQHVRSRRSVYFANRQRLQTFIEEHLRSVDAAARSGPVRRQRRRVDARSSQ
jgi:hypothetical protein